jgi:hypothetical protein
MSVMKKSNPAIVLLIGAVSILSAFSLINSGLQKSRIAGTWDMNVQTSAGNGTPVIILKQENDTLITGTYSGQLGEAPVKGVIKGNDVVLEFTASNYLIRYAGVVDGDNIKGKVTLGSIGEGTFTGRRRENLKI